MNDMDMYPYTNIHTCTDKCAQTLKHLDITSAAMVILSIARQFISVRALTLCMYAQFVCVCLCVCHGSLKDIDIFLQLHVWTLNDYNRVPI